ncbi:hypothetical protein CPJCM30710_26970 [Clostridium polyendosporum]|uniref:Cyanophycin synthetase n=1 Tax=Clostridium polyendosporum TaxID=69208 RepID=A0A919VHS8_9CLOT|nr:Mur ligase family protein [Clostridium polyendosporum]GIM30031.1 hypothetical protein CPJCM30710_26970 [Clostridium polyendosporum]
MEVKKFTILEGTNLKGINQLFYVLVSEKEQKLLQSKLTSYEIICTDLGLKGEIIDEGFSNEGYEAWVSYDRYYICLYIVESLLNGENEDEISQIAWEKVKDDWSYELILRVKDEGIPVVMLSEQEIQIGYGINSLRVNKGVFKNDYLESIDEIIKEMKIKNNGLIPIISVTGTNGKTTTVRLIYTLLKNIGYSVGMASTGGIFIGDKNIKHGDTTGFYSAREVLKNNTVDVAVLETARGGIIKKGLGYEKCCVAIITSLSEDHIGMNGIEDLDGLGRVKALIADDMIYGGKIIIRAIEPLVKLFTNREDIVLFDFEKNEFIIKHIELGGEAWYVEDGCIVLNKDGIEHEIINLQKIPFAHKGYSKGNVKNIIAALAAINTFYKDIQDVIAVLENLQCDIYTNAGRQNIITIDDYKIILDYGHNAEAFEEVFYIAKSLNPSSITGIIAAAGDRRDEYIRELGTIAARYCNHIIIREQVERRGRSQGESPEIIKKGVMNTGFNSSKVEIILKEEEAIVYAMKKAIKDEVIVLFTQCLDVVIPAINNYLDSRGLKKIAEDIDLLH